MGLGDPKGGEVRLGLGLGQGRKVLKTRDMVRQRVNIESRKGWRLQKKDVGTQDSGAGRVGLEHLFSGSWA